LDGLQFSRESPVKTKKVTGREFRFCPAGMLSGLVFFPNG
jgi:hypothetical protein